MAAFLTPVRTIVFHPEISLSYPDRFCSDSLGTILTGRRGSVISRGRKIQYMVKGLKYNAFLPLSGGKIKSLLFNWLMGLIHLPTTTVCTSHGTEHIVYKNSRFVNKNLAFRLQSNPCIPESATFELYQSPFKQKVMNKTDVLTQVSRKTGVNLVTCANVLDAFEEVLSEEVAHSRWKGGLFDKIYYYMTRIRNRKEKES
ncbi:MAG: hypothetical protein LIP06_10925 [Tannerellaceae bacterium]|nr:hypothetical protein [Tannerellaceae bacterium]